MNKNVLIILLLNIMFVKCYNIILNIGSTGLLIPYSLGALGYIKKNINTNNPQLIGTSGGAYCSVIYNYENDLSNHDEIWTDIFGLNKESKINLKNLHLFQKFTNQRLIERYKNEKIPDNIKLTALEYTNLFNKKHIYFNEYDNITDLLNKCYCSSYIPYISGNKFYTKYNNKKYIDGAVNNDYFKKYKYIENDKIINKISNENDKKMLYVNCNMWGRKWDLKNRYYLNINISRDIYNKGWKDTEKYIDKIL
jgi:hypothetical protein